jgi:succinate dehydrogenase hydrophobic anchor subunit
MYFSWSRLISDPLISAFILSLFGFLAGRLAGRSKNVIRAFLWGGLVFFGLVFGVFFLTFFVISLMNTHAYDFPATLRRCITIACLLGFLTASGSLLCGMSAIVVRDYGQSRKVRLVPQFTLQELLIVVTLAFIIMSFMASIAVAPRF